MAGFFDTSALAKVYHDEPGADFMRNLVRNSAAPYIANLGVVEMYSVLSNKVRSLAISTDEARIVRSHFLSDIRKGAFRVVALNRSHFAHAQTLLERHGDSEGLRTLDALHLAVALDLAKRNLAEMLLTSDNVLLRVALREGLVAFNPSLAV
ncbi:MAG: type II toxin-antitoxin system VapC family toxin [Acidobacteria bacterium]|nr:type II toxin-antitoxin system VapC family toxin [Acidobacteriota bacterium]